MSWASFISFLISLDWDNKKNAHNTNRSRMWGIVLRIGLLLSKGGISRSGNPFFFYILIVHSYSPHTRNSTNSYCNGKYTHFFLIFKTF